MKILIIRFSSIGDIVLTTPVMRCIKNQLGATVHYLTKKQNKSLVEHNPNIDKIHVLEDSGLLQLIEILRQEKYDHIIDLHHNIRTTLIKFSLLRPSHSFAKLNFQKWLMVNFKKGGPCAHIVDRYLETCSHLGVKNDGKGLDFFWDKSKEPEFNQQLENLKLLSNNYTVLAIGAAHFTKRIPLEKLKELVATLPGKILIIGGKDELSIANELLELKNPNLISGVGKLSLDGSAFVISKASKVVSPDTGMMHIAAAFQKPIISVWGSTVPEFGMTPYYAENTKNGNTVIEVQGLSCRPCSKIGFSSCPKGHFKCMNAIDFQSFLPKTN